MSKNNSRIDLRVPEMDKVLWQKEAERRGLDLSEVARRAIPLYLQQVKPTRTRRQRTTA